MLRALGAAILSCALVIAGGAAPAVAAPKPGPGQWYLKSYGIEGLWKATRGAGVKVAVIDSGVDDSHEDLKGTVADAADFSGAKKNGRTPVGPRNIVGHGTSVAGIISGRGVGAGPVGVAPEAKLLSASMWLGGNPPRGALSSREQAAEALRWSVDHGAKVINMSLGWDDPSWPEEWDSAFDYAYQKDAVVIACVGNRSEGAKRAWSPATVPGVVGVGGLTKSGTVSEASSAPGAAVSIMGPAEQIPVPYYQGGYAEAEGCSFASPVVSGVAALMRSAHPDWSADDVVGRLLSTAAPVKDHKGQSKGEALDPVVGYGRVDPPAALKAGSFDVKPNARRELADWVAMHRRKAPADEAGGNGGGQGASGAKQTAGQDGQDQRAVQPAAQPPRPAVVGGPAVLIVCMLVAGGLIGVAIWAGIRARRLRRH